VGKLFISYRREDTQDITARVYERLAARFGKDAIFMDVDSIPLGMDFRQVLRDAVEASSVALVMIGRQWLTVTDAQGQRRLDNPNDFVRIEVEAALARKIPVVPVLTQGVAMPRESDLPPSIGALAYRHGADVRSDHHFTPDVEQLIAQLAPVMGAASVQPVAPPPPRHPLPDVPAQLAGLGFRGVNLSGTPAIIPPLVSVAAGPFLMGSADSDTQAYDDEKPQHRVDLAAFQIGKYPVTVAEYALAVRAGAVREPPQASGVTWQTQLQHPDHPVVCVSWQDALAYSVWLREATGEAGWRLPSEAQWEKAARWDTVRGVSRIYPWGDSFDKNRCNTSESGLNTTTPVGGYPASDARRSGASPWGAEDMAGNVWEWTSSVYKPYHYTPNDGREDINSTENRVLRGGSWYVDAMGARAAYRNNGRPGDVDGGIGFRLALVGRPAGS